MTSREVKSEIEELIAPFYPEFSDSEDLRYAVDKAVKVTMFELNISQFMAVNHVKHIIWSYRNKLENSYD